MKRLALLAAAAVLGTGCIAASTSNACTVNPTLTVDWVSFTAANGITTSSCFNAQIDRVDVFLDGLPVLTNGFSCSDGGTTIVNVAAGTHLLTVEGRNSSTNQIIYRDERNVAASACGDTLVQVFPAEGSFQLDYHFSPDVCTAGGSYMWFSVFDVIANQALVTRDLNAGPTDYPCSSTIAFSAPAGTYDLDWVEERAAGGFALAATYCPSTRTRFTVAPAQQAVVSIQLADNTTTACPR